jgi:hypothetical protein
MVATVIDWEVVSAISEVLAAVAVVASLLYLARQVRDGKNTTQSATHFQVTEALNSAFFSIMQDPALFKIYKQGNQDPTKLDSDELTVYMALVGGIFARYNNYYLQYSNRTLSEEPWEIAVNHMKLLMALPGVQYWWEKNRNNYLRGMAKILDRAVREYRASGKQGS